MLMIVLSVSSSKTIIINAKAYLSCAYESKLQANSDYVKYAQSSMKSTGVYASLTLAQAIQEQSLKPNSYNNMFGIKMSGQYTSKSQCENDGGAWKQTKEYENGKYVTIMACFKTYSSPAGSFEDHGKWLLNTFANRSAFNHATTLEEQLQALVNNPNAMYATGKDYICRLIDNINSCDLTRFDAGITYNGRGVTIIGQHISNISKSGCDSYTNSLDSSKEINEHFSTSYGGKLDEGWIYNRLKDTEEWKEMNIEIEESDIDDTIDEIFHRAKASYSAFIDEYGSLTSGLTGTTIYGKAFGGTLPDYIKNSLSSPFGDQSCNQTGCFGYYFGCAKHSGTDLTSSSNANIYSAEAGIITSVNNDSRNCPPSIDSNGQVKCQAGCLGNMVTIKHSINGEEWYTKYVHMASLDSSMVVGNTVDKGQKIGIIGTSGCSTGIHLHFEIIGPGNTLYNPEELLNGNCNLNSACNSNRISCGG